MSKQLSLLIILLSICSFSFAGNQSWWEIGNLYYQQGKYDSAIYSYEQIEGRNSDVYYNLGNAHYKLNDIGNAILNYERALKANPRNNLAYENLYLTQTRINNRIQPVPKIFFIRWWNGITQSSYANTYAILSIVLFLVLIVYFSSKRLGLFDINLPNQLFVAIAALCFIFIVLGATAANRQTARDFAIVMEDNASLMKQPEYGNSSSLIPEGTKVHILSNKADWYEVKLPDGRIGWMLKEDITKI